MTSFAKTANSGALLRRLWNEVRPFRAWLVSALALVVVATAFEAAIIPLLAIPIFTAITYGEPAAISSPSAPGLTFLDRYKEALSQWLTSLVDISSRDTRLHALFLFSALVLLCYVIKCTAAMGAAYLNELLAQQTIYGLRQKLFHRLQRLSLSFFESRQTGELMARSTNDVMLLQELLRSQAAETAAAVVTLVLGLSVMAFISWQLTLFSIALVPALAWVIGVAGHRIHRITGQLQTAVARLSARLQERLTSIRIIQSFVREDFEDRRFDDVNRDTFRQAMRSARVTAVLHPIVELMSAVGLIAAICFAGAQVITGHLVIPSLVAFVLTAQKVGARFAQLGRINTVVQQALAAIRRIFEILETEPAVQEARHARALPRADGRITFRGVSFRYTPHGQGAPDGDLVLSDINLDVSPGETVALVGPSGAGKTSLANLVPRFYDPTEGAVEIDGVDLRQVTLASLRSQIAIVPQETILFAGTIRDNIGYGRLDATPEEIAAAARSANIADFIDSLPQAYETEVGERATRLSGGQRQRIAIARALLKDPRILILDEATSSLDTESEALVQEALHRLMRNRTTVVIAHRLSTIRNADRILVLSDGRIVEQGSHARLLTHGGLYARLYEMQAHVEDEPTAPMEPPAAVEPAIEDGP
jgi:subfamily B ATP-binding cassette protein MsbA